MKLTNEEQELIQILRARPDLAPWLMRMIAEVASRAPAPAAGASERHQA